MGEIVRSQANFPVEIEDLAKYVLFSEEKLNAVRAEIRAMQKLDVAESVLRQKQGEAQELGETVLYAQMRIGELTAAMPKKTAGRPLKNSPDPRENFQSKADALAKVGISNKRASEYERMAANPDIVARAIAEARDNGDVVSRAAVFDAIRTQRREEMKRAVQERIDKHATEQTGVVDIRTTNRKYNIIYADPPWQYWEGGDKNQSLHYTTMTIDDICSIPVADIADDDCALFLWVTYPVLQDVFRVIEAWGFKYSTAAFVWVKKNRRQDTPFMGCGSWTRANTELCLLATKGNVMRLDAGISQLVESPVEEHSKKPDVVRDLITRLVGELPRVELFCRHPADGWDVWGNEA
jgi:N6-adenosine-specific RNA methylase IME4